MTDTATTRLLVGPFNRVEGDLEVRLDIVDGCVQAARVNATMYRGFEQILPGKDPMDALVIVPRICGICSVSQSVAAAMALADAAGAEPPPNGRLATHLMLATENLADHLTHFYLFFMPDFTREVYAAQPWHGEVQQRFAALEGLHARQALAARQRWFEMMGTMGGKWPHTHAIVPGGSARPIDAAERLRLLARVREMRDFVARVWVGDDIERLLAVGSDADLWAWADAGSAGDLRLFLRIVRDADLYTLGAGPGRYLSHGAFADGEGGLLWPRGVWSAADAALHPLHIDTVTEDATHAWLDDHGGARHPRDGLTHPRADKAEAYTWNKAPRLGGEVVETGALARQLAAGQPLVVDAVRRHGGSVYTRVLARTIETCRLLDAMEGWLKALRPGEPWHRAATLPRQAEGVGLSEAARGALGHWLRIEDGRLTHYQIVAPTSWNFSPRDAQGVPGALEQALVGVPVEPGAHSPVRVQHVVRSFDPCMVCTVH